MDLETQDLVLVVEDFLDALRIERGASDNTIGAYRNDLVQAMTLFESVGMKAWTDLDSNMILNYEMAMGAPLAPRSSRRKISSLRTFLRFLLVKHNHKILLPSTAQYKTPKRLPKASTQDGVQKLLTVMPADNPHGLRDRALFELIYGAGLRISEAVGLRIADLNLDQGSVLVIGKREKARWIPLPAGSIEWIEKYMRDARSALQKSPREELILSDRGLAMRRTTAAQILNKYTTLAGLESMSPHQLRHSYAVHLLMNGADIRAIQELLGHESVATTQVYTELETSEVRKKYLAAHPRK